MPAPLQGLAPSAAPAAPVPQYSDVIRQLMGAAPPSSMGMFGNNPTQAFGQMTDAANQANYGRGGAILNLLSQQGATSKQSNQQQYEQELGGIDQSMMSKGLANLTVGDTLKQGAAQNLAFENNAVDERGAMNMANMAASFQQRAPDLSVLSNLLQRGGGGGTGFGGWNHGGGGTALGTAGFNGPNIVQSIF